MASDTHIKSTLEPIEPAAAQPAALMPCLTILYHPDLERIGERALLTGAVPNSTTELARTAPMFAAPGGTPHDLADPYLSRKPVLLHWSDGGVTIEAGGRNLAINDEPITNAMTLPHAELGTGVILELNERVLLLLHEVEVGGRLSGLGLVGESPAMETVRRKIHRVSDLDVPVLLRGETGVGKERVAEALVHGSEADGPYVIANMATVPTQMAASVLFGHVKGAFTGADTDHIGLFERAHGGTLFLDEVGEMTSEVQAMLLRALETGLILPLGAESDRQVNVRVIAATESALDDGSFRAPLLHRLSSYVIWIPPLRERREDIPRLVMQFLGEELARVGRKECVERADERAPAWLPIDIMKLLLRFGWPGNVRQLRNVIRQLVISNREADVASLDEENERVLGAPPAPVRVRDAQSLEDEEILVTLKRNSWELVPTARELGISRAALYRRIDKSSRIRKASDIERDELEACLTECNRDLDATAAKLQVSRRALQMRMAELEL